MWNNFEFQKYLRNKVEKRPSSLENQVIIETGFIFEYLKDLEVHGYKYDRPLSKSTLGEEFMFIMGAKKINSRNFGEKIGDELRKQTDAFLERI